jgi:hypothetical protein
MTTTNSERRAKRFTRASNVLWSRTMRAGAPDAGVKLSETG